MRLVIDLQAAQGSNRLRGIGRYSLALATAMVKRCGDGETLIALNGALDETIDPLRAAFDGLLPQSSVRVWHGLKGAAAPGPSSDWHRTAGERVREAFLASLKPDMVHTASMFEGFDDDVVTSIGSFTGTVSTAATLYDLIPLAHSEIYLRAPRLEAWYARKLAHLQRADLWLAISEHSRREAIELLGLPADRIARIGGGVDGCFQPVQLPPDRIAALRARYGLAGRFIMYTGGIDHRKNIDGLIRAYALLPEALRREHQLLVVCHAEASAKEHLQRLAASLGLRARDVVLSGFIADADLVALYNLCRAFVFPSWHEGLGLPALEAMACGAAVIASDCSSLPEVMGRPDALFNPYDPQAIAAKLALVLEDAGFRDALRAHGPRQAARFSWDETARLALEAFDDLHQRRQAERPAVHAVGRSRPHLVMVSPLPPERSGIADYSADLLPALARHYDIDVVVDQAEVHAPAVEATCRIRSLAWLASNASRCGRIVYQFGNSHFHKHMVGMLEQHPGIVVLHDFYLSGLFFHMEVNGIAPGCWSRALYDSHGYRALAARFTSEDAHGVMSEYPVNFPVLRHARGIVVHSEFARELAANWYAPEVSADWAVVPQMRALENRLTRGAARRRLGVADGDFLVCSFGILAASKLNHRLLQAWLASRLRADTRARLVFVGDHHGSEYGQALLKSIRKAGMSDRVGITGFCSAENYRHWLAAADAAVQLRRSTRGETSRAVLDCMSAGLPLIVNVHGTMRDFPVAVQLPDEFDNDDLSRALDGLRQDEDGLRQFGERARAHFRRVHAPRVVAEQYAAAIERLHTAAQVDRDNLLSSLAGLEGAPDDAPSWAALARCVVRSLPPIQPRRQLLVDVSEVAASGAAHRGVHAEIRKLLSVASDVFRVEPVMCGRDASVVYARDFACRLLGLPARLLADDPVEFARGDVHLSLSSGPQKQSGLFLREFRRCGGRAYLLVADASSSRSWAAARGHRAGLTRILPEPSNYDGILCDSREAAMALCDRLQAQQPPPAAVPGIGFLEDAGKEQGAAAAGRRDQTSWRRCLAMLADSKHGNWLGHWHPREPRTAPPSAAAWRVA